LYRTPTDVFWGEEAWPMTVQFPHESGIDPTVLQLQQPQIGDLLRNSLVMGGDTSANLAILLAGLSETAPTDPPAVQRTNALARDADWWYGLRQKIGMPLQYRYSVNLPQGYDADTTKRWPLVLYVHSGAEAGSDMNKVLESGIPLAISQGRQIPAVCVSPQCPDYEGWSSKALFQLIDDMSAKYRIDPDRIYVTGGSETWMLACIHPEKFAAAVPIEGDPDSADAARLKDLPLWAFHASNEKGVPIGMTETMVNAIRAAGGHAHLSTSDGRLDPWDVAYGEISNDYTGFPMPHDQATFVKNADAMYTWLLAQKRGQPEVMTPGVPNP
jgi:predicted peptidase